MEQEGDEENEEAVINQVLDEIGISLNDEVLENIAVSPNPSSLLPHQRQRGLYQTLQIRN